MRPQAATKSFLFSTLPSGPPVEFVLLIVGAPPVGRSSTLHRPALTSQALESSFDTDVGRVSSYVTAPLARWSAQVKSPPVNVPPYPQRETRTYNAQQDRQKTDGVPCREKHGTRVVLGAIQHSRNPSTRRVLAGSTHCSTDTTPGQSNYSCISSYTL